jgi:hypothetical protein
MVKMESPAHRVLEVLPVRMDKMGKMVSPGKKLMFLNMLI